MTDYELKKLGKSQLIQMLTDQGKEIERLENELRELQSKLLERRIHIEESGSIAEASLRLSGIFEDAQKAADEYLTNIRMQDEECASRIKEREEKAAKACEEAEKKAADMFQESEAQCRQHEEETIDK